MASKSLWACISLFFVQSAFAADFGPGVTGGGNGYKSSPAQISAAISDSVALLAYFLANGSAAPDAILNPQTPKDPLVRNVLTAWFRDKTVIKNDLQNSPHELRDEACTGDAAEGDTDASTQLILGAPICISTGRLSRVPVWALGAELFALVGHETAHHFGFDEASAQALQDYLYRNYGLIQTQYVAELTIDSIKQDLTLATRRNLPNRDQFWDRAFALQCLMIYQMQGEANAFVPPGGDRDTLHDSLNEVSADCVLFGRSSRAMYEALLKNLQTYESAIVSSATGTNFELPPAATPPSAPSKLLKCSTDAFSGGPDLVVTATIKINHDGTARLTMPLAKKGRVVTGTMHPDKTGFGTGLRELDEKIEKSIGLTAALSYHEDGFSLAVIAIGGGDIDILKCQ